MTKIIGLISGTSVDGIDAALVDVAGDRTNLKVELLAATTYPYSEKLRSQILSVCGGTSLSIAELAELDDAIAQEFAQAAFTINQKSDNQAEMIGSHGQTVYHRPPSQQLGYSLQLGRGEVIANITGIPTISNFRAADIAAGGQGAPLVPCVDIHLLSHPEYSRCIQNLGGIGNVAYIKSQKSPDLQNSILGWDTGPSNTLLDLAVQHLSQGRKTYDKNGEWAASGVPCQDLVEKWLKQDFFQQKPPKSTGRELFGKDYLFNCLADGENYNLSAADILATLTELTAASINHSYRNFLPNLPDQILLCGGGSHNLYLKERIQNLLVTIPVMTTAEVGVDVDFKEAIAFAVLAYWRSLKIPSNLPEVTGAKAKVMLGEIHQPII
ncbi:MAG: anhydro-N-acetylmuramic acid kinase [Okeania sp. SIO3B3]|nr:anhydro-N-acetylmuramic acid kinase [Okeania sp. SIO3B3]